MMTIDFQEKLSSQKTGSTVEGIKAAKLKLLTVHVPTLAEQEEIVRILHNIFSKETAAKELSNTIEKIEHMKKAILARAFRGGFGGGLENDR